MKQILLVFKRIKVYRMNFVVLGIWLIIFFVIQYVLIWNLNDVYSLSMNSSSLHEYIYHVDTIDDEDIRLLYDYPISLPLMEKCVLGGIGQIYELGDEYVDVITVLELHSSERTQDIVVSYDIYDLITNGSNLLNDTSKDEVTINGISIVNVKGDFIYLDNVNAAVRTVEVPNEIFVDLVKGNSISLYFYSELDRSDSRRVEAWLSSVFDENVESVTQLNNKKTVEVVSFFNISLIAILFIVIICASNCLVSFFRNSSKDYSVMRLVGAPFISLFWQKTLYILVASVIVYSFVYAFVSLLEFGVLNGASYNRIKMNLLCTSMIFVLSVVRCNVCKCEDGI